MCERLTPLPDFWESALQDWQAKGRLRHLEPLQAPAEGSGICYAESGEPLLSFASNDYLGLASDPSLRAAAEAELRRSGVGAGSAPLLGGERPVHAQLARALAEWLGTESVLLFGSGYLANLGVLPALASPGDRIYLDRLAHASLIDGARLSGARFRRFRHNDPEHLEQLLRKGGAGRPWIVTEGIFSMDGDVAQLPELVELAARFGAGIVLDEAHSFGVLGDGGRGTVVHWRLPEAAVPVRMGTLGKAFGCYGAFVAGSRPLIQWLVQKARTFVYHTGLPPAVAAASLRALELLRQGEDRRQHLRVLEQRLRMQLPGMPWLPGGTPIQGLVLGSNARAMEAAARLRQNGIYCPAVRPPTVPEGQARLRISLSAAHRVEDVDRLATTLAAVA